MRFRKYHGAGNDFVMISDLDATFGPPGDLPTRLVAALCDRHTGVGGDGLIRLVGAHGDAATRSAGAAVRMDYYNADGGEAEMCGNGIRCLGVMARQDGILAAGEHAVLTGAGVRRIRLEDGNHVTVDMGEPSMEQADLHMSGTGSALRLDLEVGGRKLTGTGVSMGNPHLVVFTSDLDRRLDDELVTAMGPRLEVHAAFHHKTNVEFVEVVSAGEIRMRVWERGVGETLACGTGACAAAVAAAALGRTKRRVSVQVLGGTLEVHWSEDGLVWLRGPAEEVFAGQVSSSWLQTHGGA